MFDLYEKVDMQKIFKTPNEENNFGVSIVNSPTAKQSIKIKGILASWIRPKPSSDTPYYGYLRTNDNKHSQAECIKQKCQECETPVVFRIKDPDCDGTHHLWGENCWLKPKIKKGQLVELTGFWADTDKPRPSFTAIDYSIL